VRREFAAGEGSNCVFRFCLDKFCFTHPFRFSFQSPRTVMLLFLNKSHPKCRVAFLFQSSFLK
jgi:hypothetical protein